MTQVKKANISKQLNKRADELAQETQRLRRQADELMRMLKRDEARFTREAEEARRLQKAEEKQELLRNQTKAWTMPDDEEPKVAPEVKAQEKVKQGGKEKNLSRQPKPVAKEKPSRKNRCKLPLLFVPKRLLSVRNSPQGLCHVPIPKPVNAALSAPIVGRAKPVSPVSVQVSTNKALVPLMASEAIERKVQAVSLASALAAICQRTRINSRALVRKVGVPLKELLVSRWTIYSYLSVVNKQGFMILTREVMTVLVTPNVFPKPSGRMQGDAAPTTAMMMKTCVPVAKGARSPRYGRRLLSPSR